MKQGIFYSIPDKYKYSLAFNTNVKPLVGEDRDKYLAMASKDKLTQFLPKDANIIDNVSLLGFAGNAFVANRINANDDTVLTKEALLLADRLPYIFCDIEHSRKDLVGVVLSAGFSEFGTDKVLSREEVSTYTKPFNVTIGGVVWRIINDDFTNALEELSSPDSKENISISWEIGFSEIDLILIDAGKSNTEDGEIISGENRVRELESGLRALGGNGRISEKRLARVVKNDCVPLGMGFVSNPAAEVGGVVIDIKNTEITEEEDEEEDKEEEEDDNEDESESLSTEEIRKIRQLLVTKTPEIDNIKNNENNLSQFDASIVNDCDINIKKDFMKLTKIQDLTEDSLKECKAADITNLYDDAIKKINEDFKTKLEEKENTAKAANDKVEEITKSQQEIQSKLDKITEDYNKLVEANKQAELVQVFSARMSSLEEQFELNVEERSILAEEIKACDSEETYAKFLKKSEIFLKNKKKDKHTGEEGCTCAKCKSAKASLESNASVNDDANTQKTVDDAIKNAEKAKAAIANAGEVKEETLADKAKKAFGIEGWTTENKRKNRNNKN